LSLGRAVLMQFDLTDEQQMLRDMLSAYLRDRLDFDARRAAIASECGRDTDMWRALAEELGILGAAFPEAHGGLGGGAVETMIVMEEFGRALVTEPYLGTAVIAGGFLKHSGHERAAPLIGELIAGRLIGAFAWAEPRSRYDFARCETRAARDGANWRLDGRKIVVVGAPWATHLLVTARTAGDTNQARGLSLFLLDRDTPGVSMLDYSTVDGGRAADVTFEKVLLPADALIGVLDDALPLIERVMDEALAATAAEACGVMRRLYEDTVDYTKQRQQFGVPIASFQVLQHRMVDMFIHVERAAAMTQMATLALDGDADARGRAVSAAMVQIGHSCRFVGQNAVQLHGGIGVTDELPVAHYFKRATMIEILFGSVDHHLDRFERLSFEEQP
jgi:alkylation response protein AidB-like acyl-CoA dehydrogenase